MHRAAVLIWWFGGALVQLCLSQLGGMQVTCSDLLIGFQQLRPASRYHHQPFSPGCSAAQQRQPNRCTDGHSNNTPHTHWTRSTTSHPHRHTHSQQMCHRQHTCSLVLCALARYTLQHTRQHHGLKHRRLSPAVAGAQGAVQDAITASDAVPRHT